MNCWLVISLLALFLQYKKGYCVQAMTCSAKVAARTIHRLNWSKMAIIHDKENALINDNLQNVELMVYEIDAYTMLKIIFQEINMSLFPDVNVVVALSNEALLETVMHEADSFDIKVNHSVDFSHHSKWLVFTRMTALFIDDSRRLRNLQNIAVLGHCTSSGETFSLRSAFGDFRFLPVNQTTPLPLRIFPNIQYGYNTRTLRVSALESPPFVINRDGIPYTGFCIDVLDIIVAHLNMTINYVKPKDGTWGWIEDGMIGQLNRREIDLVASEITVHVKRAQHIDYIQPFLKTDDLVLLYKMRPATQPLFLLAGPFQIWVYLVYLAATCSSMILFVVTETFGRRSSATPKKGDMFWEMLKPSLKQSLTFTPMATPSRILLAFWWMLVVLISSLYCGQLTATLATNSRLVKFKNIDEVVDSGFSVGLVAGGILDHMLKDSPQKDVRRLYKTIVPLDTMHPSNNKDYQIKQVRRGNHGFVTYQSTVDVLIQEDCSLAVLYFGNKLQHQLTFAVQKHSPFKEDIDRELHKLQSGGILKHMWKDLVNKTKAMTCQEETRSVNITDLIGGVIVATAGIALALLCLLIEWMSAQFK